MHRYTLPGHQPPVSVHCGNSPGPTAAAERPASASSSSREPSWRECGWSVISSQIGPATTASEICCCADGLDANGFGEGNIDLFMAKSCRASRTSGGNRSQPLVAARWWSPVSAPNATGGSAAHMTTLQLGRKGRSVGGRFNLRFRWPDRERAGVFTWARGNTGTNCCAACPTGSRWRTDVSWHRSSGHDVDPSGR